MNDTVQLKVAFESDSENGVRYVVDYYQGEWYCKCPAFRMNGKGYVCKHIYRWQQAYESFLKAAAKETAPDKFKRLTKPRYGTLEKPVVAGGKYNFGKGMNFGRVTSIISECKDPSYLINWASKLGAQAMRDSFDLSLQEAIDATMELHKDASQQEQLDEVFKLVSKNALTIEEAAMAPIYYKQKKARIGTNVHDYLEIFNSDKPDKNINDLTVAERPYVYGFLKWVEQMGGRGNITTLSQEKPVLSKKHKYAGKYDWIASINGKVWLLDFKTSKWVFEDVGLQLKAYAEAIVEMGLIDKIDFMGVIHLRPDEQGLLIPFDEPLKPFLGMRDVWQWRQSKKGGE